MPPTIPQRGGPSSLKARPGVAYVSGKSMGGKGKTGAKRHRYVENIMRNIVHFHLANLYG